MLKKRILSSILIGVFCITSGCQLCGHQPASANDPIAEYHRLLIEERRYYDANVKFSSVKPEFETMSEGVLGMEYDRLLSMTAGTGHKEWQRIFKSPSIPIEQKIDLVKKIHEHSLCSN